MKIKGTVATRQTKSGPKTSTLTVMREYLSWGLTPEYWSDSRAMELAVTMEWALSKIPTKVKRAQEKLEARAKRETR
jgi:hypothetical protein